MSNDMRYTPLCRGLVLSSIWCCEPDHVRILWITMLALAEDDGYVGASLPGLAQAARLTIDQVKDALERLQKPDPDSRSLENDGQRVFPDDRGWVLPGVPRYRQLVKTERQRELAAERQARFRENQTKNKDSNAHVTQSNDDVTQSNIPVTISNVPSPLSNVPSRFGNAQTTTEREREREKDTDTEKKKRESALYPSFEEVQEFARTHSLTLDVKFYFDLWSGTGWKDTQGRPILDWKSKFLLRNHDEVASRKAKQFAKGGDRRIGDPCLCGRGPSDGIGQDDTGASYLWCRVCQPGRWTRQGQGPSGAVQAPITRPLPTLPRCECGRGPVVSQGTTICQQCVEEIRLAQDQRREGAGEAAQEVPQGCDGDIAGLAGEIVQPGRVDDEAWDAGEGAEI